MSDEPRPKGKRWQPLFVQIPMPVMEHFAELRRRGGRREAFEIDSAFLTYAGLRSFRNNVKASDRVGKAYPSARKIAERTGQGERTVVRNLPLLEKWGLVFRDPRPGSTAIVTIVDEPKVYIRDASESGPERAKGLVERENEAVTRKARSKAAREAGRRRPPPHVADPPVTGDRPPLTHVAADQDQIQITIMITWRERRLAPACPPPLTITRLTTATARATSPRTAWRRSRPLGWTSSGAAGTFNTSRRRARG